MVSTRNIISLDPTDQEQIEKHQDEWKKVLERLYRIAYFRESELYSAGDSDNQIIFKLTHSILLTINKNILVLGDLLGDSSASVFKGIGKLIVNGDNYVKFDASEQYTIKIMHSQLLTNVLNEREFIKKLAYFGDPDSFTFYFDDEQYVGVVIKYLPGKCLSEIVGNQDIKTNDRLQITLAVLKAVNDVHGLNIVHRDISEGNIIINNKAKGDLLEWDAKLIDFGLAAWIDNKDEHDKKDKDDKKNRVGTSYYMARECWERREITAQTDIWAAARLIAVLWQMDDFVFKPSEWWEVAYDIERNYRSLKSHVDGAISERKASRKSSVDIRSPIETWKKAARIFMGRILSGLRKLDIEENDFKQIEEEINAMLVDKVPILNAVIVRAMDDLPERVDMLGMRLAKVFHYKTKGDVHVNTIKCLNTLHYVHYERFIALINKMLSVEENARGNLPEAISLIERIIYERANRVIELQPIKRQARTLFGERLGKIRTAGDAKAGCKGDYEPLILDDEGYRPQCRKSL